MDTGYPLGTQVIRIEDNFLNIKNMAMVFINGLMEKNSEVFISEINNMVLESWNNRTGLKNLAYMKMMSFSSSSQVIG